MRADGEENAARPARTPRAAAAAATPAAEAADAPCAATGGAGEAVRPEAAVPGGASSEPGRAEPEYPDPEYPDPEYPDPEEFAEPEDLGSWEEFRKPGQLPAPAPKAVGPGGDTPETGGPAAPPEPEGPGGPPPAGLPEAALPDADGLSAQDVAVLALESRGGRVRGGAKERVIREQLEMSPTRYYQLLNALLDDPAALRHAPVTVNRLRRVRDERRAQR